MSSTEKVVGVIGATSFAGQSVLERLRSSGRAAECFSRQTGGANRDVSIPIQEWICVAPIWVLPEYFSTMKKRGARRVVAVSSTSRFTKMDSNDVAEKEVAEKLTQAETLFQDWARQNQVEWVILRPTLIYGNGLDRNISEIVRIVRKFGFFPLLGSARGLRQPLHVDDVADACVTALSSAPAANRAYEITGGETLEYREMVRRVFNALGRKARMPTIPRAAFRAAVHIVRLLPRYRGWTTAMADRMARDLVFDAADARRDLGFQPRKFELSEKDLRGSFDL